MPDNFVPIEIVYYLYVHACRNVENLPSFCSGTAKSQLRPAPEVDKGSLTN